MKKFSISSGTLKRIKERASKLPLLNNSIRGGVSEETYRKGVLVAYIGEEVVKKVLDGDIKDTYDYDIIYNGIKVDVKTKERTVSPEPHFNCTVADFNTKQSCDEYAFVNVLKNLSCAWYLGKIDKKTFFEEATFYKKGELDPDSPPWKKFYFQADCHNLPVRKLICS